MHNPGSKGERAQRSKVSDEGDHRATRRDMKSAITRYRSHSVRNTRVPRLTSRGCRASAPAVTEGDAAQQSLNLSRRAPMTMAMERRTMQSRKRVRPTLTQPSLVDVIGGLVLLAIAALLVAIAVVAAAG